MKIIPFSCISTKEYCYIIQAKAVIEVIPGGKFAICNILKVKEKLYWDTLCG